MVGKLQIKKPLGVEIAKCARCHAGQTSIERLT